MGRVITEVLRNAPFIRGINQNKVLTSLLFSCLIGYCDLTITYSYKCSFWKIQNLSLFIDEYQWKNNEAVSPFPTIYVGFLGILLH